VTPYSFVDGYQCFEGSSVYRVDVASSTLKLDAVGFSETLVSVCQTTWRHVLEDYER
jgi:hypothetical protein